MGMYELLRGERTALRTLHDINSMSRTRVKNRDVDFYRKIISRCKAYENNRQGCGEKLELYKKQAVERGMLTEEDIGAIAPVELRYKINPIKDNSRRLREIRDELFRKE